MDRPDGASAKTVGWTLIAIGICACFVSANADQIRTFWLAIAIANIGIATGMILISLGYVVHAISFLPSKADLNSAILREEPDGELRGESELEVNRCEWCELNVARPFLPCSDVGTEELQRRSATVSSIVCQTQLKERGF